ncbi:hypothetical protein M885DRAFT_504449 [Pelagophyceae sp. CCMP2097]|nr:hypothetical protein M885DRAFT_504449 [Pelagophyceae sp. CCMP2097]
MAPPPPPPLPADVLRHVAAFAGAAAFGRGPASASRAWAAALRSRVHAHLEIVDARLPEAVGRLLVASLDCGRFAVVEAGHASCSMRLGSPDDVQLLRQRPGGHVELHRLTAMLWTHWRGAFPRMQEFAAHNAAVWQGLDAAVNVEAARWPRQRVTGTFWVLMQRRDGAVVVREDDSKVYVVAGMASTLMELLQGIGEPPYSVHLSLLPFKQYVSFDGLVSGAAEPLRSARERRAKRRELLRIYAAAVDRGKVITSFPGGPAPAPARAAPEDNVVFSAALLAKRGRIVAAAVRPGAEEKLVFRRFGYTLEENPNLLCGMMRQNGAFAASLVMQGLELTVEEVVDAILGDVEASGRKPNLILVDTEATIAPLKRLFGNGLHVEYYPPPSAEEARMHQQGPPPKPRQRAVAIAPTTPVRVRGLAGNAQLNGRGGDVLRLDSASGRYNVALYRGNADEPARTVSVQPHNLLQLYDVENVDDASARAVIVDAEDGDEGYAYVVRDDVGRDAIVDHVLKWPAAVTVLPVGALVLVFGVSSAQWKNRWALVEAVDRAARRYTLRQPDGTRANIRFGAVHV